MSIEHLNPADMHRNPAFSQAVAVGPGSKLLFIGGQNGVNAQGVIVAEDLVAQTRQVFQNLKLVLAEVGGDLSHVVKWTIFVVQGQDPRAGFGVFLEEWGVSSPPPAISFAFVAGLGVPGALVEIEAVAAIPIG